MTMSGMTIAMVGDLLIQHRLSPYGGDGRFEDFLRVLREADVGIGNLECAVYDGDDSPAFVAGGSRGGGVMAAPPWSLEEIWWMGIEAVWAANNHSADLGEGGVVTTLDYLDDAGFTHAGTGRSLSEATAPAYRDTGRGRMALISASDWGPRGKADLPYPIPHGVMAADQGAAFPDRPGLNLLRFDAPLHVDREALDALRRISAKLGWEEAKERRRRGGGRDEPLVGPELVGGEQDDDEAFHFMGTRFVAGDAFSFETVPYEADLERNYKWVAEARRQADTVVVGLHQQGASRSEREPPDHTRIFAHGAIDAGADVFVAHGRSRIGGVEIYKGKVILYGLPGFVRQREQLRHVPLEHMERWGLSYGAAAGEFLERRDEGEQGHTMPPGFRRTAIYVVEAGEDGAPREVRVYPGEMSEGSRAQSGRPLRALPGSEMERRVLDAVVQRCETLGTQVEVRDGVAVIPVS